MAISTGTGDTDFDRLAAILAAVPQIQYICVDVANGYSEHFVHFVKDVRQKFPSHTIMVSGSPCMAHTEHCSCRQIVSYKVFVLYCVHKTVVNIVLNVCQGW